MSEVKKAIDTFESNLQSAREETEAKIAAVGKETGEVKDTMNRVSEDLTAQMAKIEEGQKAAVKAEAVDAMQAKFDEQSGEFKKVLEEQKERLDQLNASAVYQAQQTQVSPDQRAALAKHTRNEVLRKWMRTCNSGGQRKVQADAKNIFETEVAEQKSIYVGNDPSAGYLADRPQYEAMFDALVNEFSTFRSRAEMQTLVGTNHLERPVNLKGGVGAGWESETVTRSDTGQPTADLQMIMAHWARASVLISEQQLEDSYLDVEGWVTGEAAENFALLEDDAWFNGDGVNKPRGVLTLPATAAAAGSTYKFIQQVNSGAAATFTTDGILELIGSMKEIYHAGAEFYLRREALFTDLYTLKDNEDRYYLVPDWSQGLTFRLLGYPVRMAPPMPLATAGLLAMVFANLSRGYTIVERSGLNILTDPFSTKPFVEMWFRRRVGGDIRTHEAIKIQKISA